MQYYLITPDDALVGEVDGALTDSDVRQMLRSNRLDGFPSSDNRATVYYTSEAGHPPSPRAALILRDVFGVTFPLYGAAVVCGNDDGHDVSLPEDYIDAITDAASQWLAAPWEDIQAELT